MDIQQIKGIKLNFILATARIGSTLLSAMLNMHPNVISTTEEPFAYTLYPKYKNIKKWTSEIIQEFCFDFYLFSEGKLKSQFGTKKDLETILEKHKPYLTFDMAIRLTYLCFYPDKDKSEITALADKQLGFHSNLKKIAKAYPHSKFVILHRDPRDQVLSLFLLAKKTNENVRSYLFWAYVWRYKYKTLLKKAVKINRDRFLEVKYEDLILNPETELKRICLFFEIPYNSIMLEYDEHFKKLGNNASISTTIKQEFLSIHGSLIQKVNREKIGVWKQGLKPEEADLIWTVCGNLAEEIGYIKDEYFIKPKNKIVYYFTFIQFLIERVLILKVYYASPFFVKYLIKRIKSGKN